jgi:hypothetical protein
MFILKDLGNWIYVFKCKYFYLFISELFLQVYKILLYKNKVNLSVLCQSLRISTKKSSL